MTRFHPVRALRRLALAALALLLSATSPLALSRAEAQPRRAAPAAPRPAGAAGATVSARLKARAQSKAPAAQPSGGEGKVIEFKQLSVEGTVQRPSAAYLLQRRKLKFRGLEPKQTFLPQVIESVQRPPF